MNFKFLGAIVAAALFVAPALAEKPDSEKQKGKAGQRPSSAAQIMKQLDSVSLTDDQKSKIVELGKTADAETKAVREEFGLTKELVKKRGEAQKSLKDSGKKGKEMAAAINQEAGISEAQASGFEKINAVRMKFQKSVVAMLTAEQKESLPKQLQRAAKDEKPGKGKKKKDAQ